MKKVNATCGFWATWGILIYTPANLFAVHMGMPNPRTYNKIRVWNLQVDER